MGDWALSPCVSTVLSGVCEWAGYYLVVDDVLPELGGSKAAVHNHRAPGRQRGEQSGDEAVHVEQRHDEQRPVVRRQLVGPLDVVQRARQVLVRQQHALRAGGRARRVHVPGRGRRGGGQGEQ